MPYDGSNEFYDESGLQYDEGERSSSSSSLGLSSSSSSLGLSSSSSSSLGYSSSSSSEEDELAALDRTDICAAIEALFEADSTLYGANGYLNKITSDVIEYDKARVSNTTPYKMFLKAIGREKIATRMCNNTDYAITVEYRIEGVRSDPQTAYENIDDIDDRIDHLIDNQMWTGSNLASYYSNDESTVIDVVTLGSSADVRKDDGGWKVECEGSVRVEINRINP